ncbi:host cell division inhibitor Icd-like protein [Cedecea sp. NFIX57]|uniref:host cell division inhibitor Icd-like protein n=1 Tax=Cedecea sp. NFIX57 TaxID=1566286 RepID=UPI0015931704|nr:host cell division inhibitor Icd-like protein [Cedecea sp. NFIX57]
MATLSLSAPQTYVFKFAAFDRSADVFLPVTVSVIAASEREARRAFARDYVLLMTARLPFADAASHPIAGVNHAE